MKTNNRSKKFKILLLSLAALLLMSCGAYAYYQFTSNIVQDNGMINYGPATEDEKKTAQQIKDRVVENKSETPVSGSDPSPTPVQQSDGSLPVVGVSIVAAINNGDNYRVQTMIQTVTNSGQCSLEITDSANHVYKSTSEVQALPSSSTCKGFTIPSSALDTGKWMIKLQFQNDSVRGSAEKEVVV